jgi:hypothetical protein
MITHASNIVEHPELIAQRILRFADLVGHENVMAGGDCGFSSQLCTRLRCIPRWSGKNSKRLDKAPTLPPNGFGKRTNNLTGRK